MYGIKYNFKSNTIDKVYKLTSEKIIQQHENWKNFEEIKKKMIKNYAMSDMKENQWLLFEHFYLIDI